MTLRETCGYAPFQSMTRHPIRSVLLAAALSLAVACHDAPPPPSDTTDTTTVAAEPATQTQRADGKTPPRGEQKQRDPEWKRLASIFGIGETERPATQHPTGGVRDVTIPTAAPPAADGGQASGMTNRVGGTTPAPARPQPGTPQSRPATAGGGVTMPYAAPPTGSRPGTSGGGPATSTQPIDPSSDRQPPMFAGAGFNPPQISDGEVATLLVTATDDLAGVRDISGVVTSPNGKAVIGFFCQPSNQADVFAAQITVPKNADRGNWYVGTMYLVDRANNGKNFSFNAGTSPARLAVVSSQADSTPPVLRSVRVEKQSISEGETNRVTVDADDDASGIKSISGIFLSPTKSARVGFGGRPQGDSGVWSGDIVLPKGADCGTWALQQVEVLDGADNRAIFSASDPLVNGISFLFVGNSCDSDPPTLESLTLNPLEVENENDGEITITAIVSDDKTGVAGVSGRVDGPPSTSGQRPSIYFSLTGNREDPSAPWVGKIRIAKFSAAGAWHIGSMQVIDRANNIKIFGPNDRQLAGASFTVR